MKSNYFLRVAYILAAAQYNILHVGLCTERVKSILIGDSLAGCV